MEAVVWHCESHSVFFNSYIFTWKCPLQWVFVWIEATGFYWVLIGAALRYPVVAVYHRDLVDLDL